MTLRVLLADDQALLRGTFRLLIDAEPDMEVVGEAGTGREAVDLARAERPDVIVMDIRMPDLDGLSATGMITANPGLAGVKILILTTFEDDEYVAHTLRASSTFLSARTCDAAPGQPSSGVAGSGSVRRVGCLGLIERCRPAREEVQCVL
jgi:DNA-binding NarL/FixJ family response regulator